jgi:hypothetical protein
MIGILEDAIHRANLDTLGGLVVPHALRAELGIDHIDLIALANGAVGALGLAHIAVDAFVSDVKRHGKTPGAGEKRKEEGLESGRDARLAPDCP